MLVLAYSVVLSFVACLYVGMIWRVSFYVDLGCYIVILMYCIEGFSWGVLGITHPWIGKKWPCGGRALVGPQ